MGQDVGDGLEVGEERDKGERFLAGGTVQREDFKDPSQEGGPPGGPGGGGIGWLGCGGLGCLGLGRQSPRARGEWARLDARVDGEGIVLPGPGRDQRPQRSVGGEDPMVPVAMDAGWREDFGQPIQKPERIRATRRVSL
jgi:hypothetical protein